MDFIIKPSMIAGGDISVPGDKSISHRALMFSAIADGVSQVRGFLPGEDCLRTLAAIEAMGVRVERPATTDVIVHGVGRLGLRAPETDLDMGNSGTAMRLFSGLLAAQSFDSCLIGDESLSGRPMGRIVAPLSDMGARIQTNDGKPPLVIAGDQKLKALHYESPVASAQVKSAVLLAGLYAAGTTTVIEPAVTRDHTERMLAAMGVDVQRAGLSVCIAGGQALKAIDIEVPADLSSAAFPLAAALLSRNGEITVRGVGLNPTRTGVLQILRQMGARIEVTNERKLGGEPVGDISAGASTLVGIDVDPSLVSLAIDEFPLLFALAGCAEGATTFSGIGELRVKESDRIGAMATGLRALGIRVDESADGAVIYGGKPTGGAVDSFLDHRIAMAFSVLGTVASGPLQVRSADNVETSFPGFIACMQATGADIERADGS